MFLLALGCSLPPLPETPIEGGSRSAQALVRAGLSAFDEAVGVDRLRIRAIRFAPLDTPGRYAPAHRRIELDEGIALDELGHVLRHELCHALDEDEALSAEPSSPWGEVALALQHTEAIEGFLEAHADRAGERLLRAEALASLCGAGPEAAGLLAPGCEGEPRWVGEASRWLLERVWLGAAPLPGLELPAERWWDPGSGPFELLVVGTVQPYVVQVGTVWEGTPYEQLDDRVYVDVRSGVLDWPDGAVALDPDSLPTPSDALLADAPSTGLAIELPDGTAAALLSVLPPALPAPAERLAWRDGERWQLVDDRCDTPRRLVATAGRAWVWRSEADVVRWQPIGPE